MALVAIAAIAVPLLESLRPTARSIENSRLLGTAVDLDKLPRGTYLEKAGDRFRVFVINDFDGDLHVFTVNHHHDVYWIADPTWNLPFRACSDFGPDASGNKLIRGGEFRCRDSDRIQESKGWDFDGSSKSNQYGDMIQRDYVVMDDMLLIEDVVFALSEIRSL